MIVENKISHIIDPSTGFPEEKSISSTIITDNAMDADGLSTATFVLGPEKGLKLIKKYKNAECLMIDKEKKIFESEGFIKYE
ncbi:MAG: hypothetical protein A2539_02560 [Elusimicrobia bacterium RIFOXYD2_FULL_34_15]|nr:MAG: hypothetical protein A2539_02560 [Elusimicrobia bacterium RIFOXYD2_FULL_34_15]